MRYASVVQSGTVAAGKRSPSAIAAKVADSRWADRALRCGLAARGVVFLIFGYLVARVALGALGQPSTSKPADLTGVPEALAAQPGGRVALCAIAIGMILYALFSVFLRRGHRRRPHEFVEGHPGEDQVER